jgi:protein tyrosine phosphatase (PTP) superfamily phosphohydrolase (DUF442 family)
VLKVRHDAVRVPTPRGDAAMSMNTKLHPAIRLLAPVLLMTVLSAMASLPATPPALPPVGNRQPATLPGLHNVFHLSAKLYSGSVPEGEAGFRSLRDLGIRTIITVDGARPDVAMARRYGMRYVHLPFGYDGCPLPTATRIVRAVRDLPGPIYLHCHHGKHRSPAAAALVQIALDRASNDEAVAFMRRAGTAPEYTGLYAEAQEYRRPTRAEIDRAPADFPELAPVPPLAEAMVRIDQRFTHLQLAWAEDWGVPKAHPDILPAHEALQLHELFHELTRDGSLAGRPAPFHRDLSAAEAGAAALEAALRAGQREDATRAMDRVAATCVSCHAVYRNVPRGGVPAPARARGDAR